MKYEERVKLSVYVYTVGILCNIHGNIKHILRRDEGQTTVFTIFEDSV